MSLTSLRRPPRLALSLVALSLSAVASAQGSVLVVDDEPGPDVDFTSLSSAVDAAQDGDTLLVRTGLYGGDDGIRIVGKSLVIVADRGQSPVVWPKMFKSPLSVSGLAPGQEVVVRGLTFQYELLVPHSLFLQNQGSVRIEDCRFFGNPLGVQGLYLIHVAQNDSFVMTRTEVAWGRGDRPAIQVEDSSFSAYDVRVTGGSPRDGVSPIGGGDAIRAFGSHLFLSNTRLIGGDAEDGEDRLPLCDGGDGGDALAATNCTVVLRDVSLTGGAPGLPSEPTCAVGVPGQALALQGGTLIDDTDAAPRLDASSPIVEGHFARLTFHAPGAHAFALISTQAGHAPVAPIGELLVTAPAVLAFDGAIPAHGKTVLFPIGALPGGQARTFHVQGAVADPVTAQVKLTNASAVTVLAEEL